MQCTARWTPLLMLGALILGAASTARAVEDEGKTVYRYIYPPPPQQGPPERSCFTFRPLKIDVTTLDGMIVEVPAEDYLVGTGPAAGAPPTVTPTLWMVPTRDRVGTVAPNDDQGDLQLDNTLGETITAFAVAIPHGSLTQPIVPYDDPVYTGQAAGAWQSALVRREQWDANVWSDLSIGSQGSPTDDVPALLAPADWTPLATGGPGRQFTDLFGNDPSLGGVALFWTSSVTHGIAPGGSRIGFHLGATGQPISAQELPFVSFGAGTLHQAGRITAVPEPATWVLALASLCVSVRGRR